jgi:hypothetical protein
VLRSLGMRGGFGIVSESLVLLMRASMLQGLERRPSVLAERRPAAAVPGCIAVKSLSFRERI